MNLALLQTKIKEFDQKAGWDKTKFTQLVDFMQRELDNLKQTDSKNKDRINHLLTDLLILIIQSSYRYNTNFEAEVDKWFKEIKEK
ncbi:MAG: hypothetical protein HQ538_06505 [Parcubacteria group bacterium]|nr:hypothetical protein [Parcubacteria group bacterium]